MATRVTDQEFVEFVIKQIVDKPEEVKVERKVDDLGVLITLSVSPEDMGMVIGREGATAKAVRTLLRVVGARENARVNLKINEPEGSTFVRKERKNGNGNDTEDANAPTRRTLDEVVGDLDL